MPEEDFLYEPEDIEEAVQKYWADNETFSITEDPNKEKKHKRQHIAAALAE